MIMLTRSDIFGMVQSAKHSERIVYPLDPHAQKQLVELVRLMAIKIETECQMSLEAFLMPNEALGETSAPYDGEIDWDRVYVDSVKGVIYDSHE